ncbi:hypothetical protein K9N08_04480 [Candidatus Gracilibacteria bacterium]|nr:hypothetical protein [Candidatus Gracilibacteria bacterium]MCF7856768.1 hypothetical protein [Candidatus Gracilibacteria bacterium]MCF7897069.1 hypothetical protein [Candidatus Gracilibacteria bacterium]
MTYVSHEKNPENSAEKSASKLEKIDVGALESSAAISEVAGEIAKAAVEATEVGESLDEAGEGFSEQKGDSKKSFSGSGTRDDQAAVDLKAHIAATISTQKMQKQVAAEIRKEIRKSEKKVLLAHLGLKKYSPNKLAEMISKIRSLRDLLGSIVEATKEVLIGLYLKWVRKEVG